MSASFTVISTPTVTPTVTTGSNQVGQSWLPIKPPRKKPNKALKKIQAFEMAVLKRSMKHEFSKEERIKNEEEYHKAFYALMESIPNI